MAQPVPREAGVSPERERRWGLIGGVAGSVLGVGSATVAIVIDGASIYESGPYPEIFERTELLAIDVYLLLILLIGAGFSTAAVVYAKRSPYPRTDAFGAALTGLILTTLAGLVLFVRLYALLGAR